MPEQPAEDEAITAAVQAWRISPVTALVIRWLLPAVGALMDELCDYRHTEGDPRP